MSAPGKVALGMTVRLLCIVLCCLLSLALNLPGYGQIKLAPNDEYKAKAKFLFNFGKFTSWPDDVLANNDRFKLCLLGGDPFGLFLDLLAVRGIRRHDVEIHRLRAVEKAAGCHLLFLAEAAIPDEGRIPSELLRRGMFVIADTPGLAARGVVANLVMEKGQVRFEINLDAARRADLILDTQLLRLGRLRTDEKGKQP
ncbi:MAG: YfiR family protein [Geminicoccaceae bacterium]